MLQQNAGEPCGPETEASDLSSLEHKCVPEGETQLTERYNRAGLGGAEPQGRIQGWPLVTVAAALPPRVKGGDEHPALHLRDCCKVAGVNRSARPGDTG